MGCIFHLLSEIAEKLFIGIRRTLCCLYGFYNTCYICRNGSLGGNGYLALYILGIYLGNMEFKGKRNIMFSLTAY